MLGLVVLGASCSSSGPDGAPATSERSNPTIPDDGRPVVLVAGDSVLDEAAAPLTFALEQGDQAHGAFVVEPDLPRDEADRALWQAQLDEYDPDLVVVSVGHWEYLEVLGDFAEGDLLEPGTYRTQVLEPFADLVTDGGRRPLLWVGPLTIRDADEAGVVDGLEEDFRALADERDDVDFVDGDRWIAPAGYTDRLGGVQVRRADGIHLCPAGQVRLAHGLLPEIARRLDIDVPRGWMADWEAERPDEPGGCAPDYQGD